MTPELVIYDFDGTLVDTAPVVSTLLNQYRHELGLEDWPVERFIPYLSLGGLELIKNSLELNCCELSNSYLKQFREKYSNLPGSVSPLYPGVLDCLDLLRENNIQIAICSNKPRALIDNILKSYNLNLYFQSIIAGDDLPTKKPDPRNLLACIEQVNKTVENSLLIGDSKVDQQTAKNANVQFAFFSQGYNDGVDKSQSLVFNDHLKFIRTLI